MTDARPRMNLGLPARSMRSAFSPSLRPGQGGAAFLAAGLRQALDDARSAGRYDLMMLTDNALSALPRVLRLWPPGATAAPCRLPARGSAMPWSRRRRANNGEPGEDDRGTPDFEPVIASPESRGDKV